MIPDEVLTLLRASLAAAVKQNFGAWAAPERRPVIGEAVYEVSASGLEVCLGTEGLSIAGPTQELRQPYEALAIVPPSLKELSQVIQNGSGTLRLMEGSVEHTFKLPPAVYSDLLNALYKVVRFAS